MVTVAVTVALAAAAVGAFVLTRRDDSVELTAAQARSALLLPHEVGIGYEPTSFDSEEGGFLSITRDGQDEADRECLGALEDLRPGDPEGALDRLFGAILDPARSRSYRSALGAQVHHGVDEDDDGEALPSHARRVVGSCGTLLTDDGRVVRLASRPDVELGDDSASFTLTTEIQLEEILGDEGAEYVADMGFDLDEPMVMVFAVVIWTRDDVASILATADVTSGPPGLPLGDPDRIDDLARRADDKLVEVIEEAG